jgi:release factor glutamine methyltransferase
MQLKQAQDAAYKILLENDVPSPRLNAELLLQFVLGRERAYLYAHPERELTPEEQAEYNEVIAQRARGCPTQYITGHQEFWGLDLLVSPAVLIPRPETEHVVETVLELVKEYYAEHQHLTGTPDPAACAEIDSGRIRVVDVGVGSGCIALALASELSQAEVHGCDISEDALEMARVNAARLGLGSRVLFRKSDLLEVYLSSSGAKRSASAGDPAGASGSSTLTTGSMALAAVPRVDRDPASPDQVSAQGQCFDFVVSNPPYVGESEADKVQRQVREFEPKLAVFSGHEGMEVYRRLVPQARQALRPGGWLVMEIGYSTEDKIRMLLASSGCWSSVQVIPDLQGIPRVVAARKAFA